jgi:DNA-binding cell septation regulator SpoVG
MSNEVIKIIEDVIREIFEREERKRVGELILELNEKLKNTKCVAIDLMFLGDDIGVAIECIKALNVFVSSKDLRVTNVEDITENTLKNIRETIKERIKEMLRRPPPIRVFDI